MADTRSLIRTLELPYENVRTMYEGDSEVRLYRNELTDELQVGKRFDLHGMESSIAVVQEGALLRRVNHPNVTPVYDVARVNGYAKELPDVVEVIMPYYERGSIYDAFGRGERFMLGEAVRMVAGALHGLAELHEVHGILHRDIKTPNLFLGADGRLLVGDLGVAAEMEADGTVEALPNARLYSPPEGLTTRRLDRRADLYQLGLVFHELMSGPLPYDDPVYAIDEIAKRLNGGRRAVLPRHLSPAPWVPPRLRTVINKATAADPSRRYPNAKAMVDALVRAPRVDWQIVVNDANFRRWEGATPQRPDRRFAVEVRYLGPKPRRRRTGWSMSGLQQVRAWRRVLPDALVSSLSDRQATNFFDSMVAIATNR